MKMDAQTVTIISGVLLVGVFLLVGWRLKRRERAERRKDGGRTKQ